MKAKCLVVIFCASMAASGPATAYQGLEADYAACAQGHGKVSKSRIVQACTRLINNAAKENALVGMFYALRASANSDRRSNCRDARKALELMSDPKLVKSARTLENMNCSTRRSSAGRPKACGVQLDQYIARLGRADHFNSSGLRLKSVPAILRQDRANYHVFGRRDRSDESDQYFSKKSNRARMELLLASGTISAGARKVVLNGMPEIRVTVCAQPDAIFVEVAN